jgi:phage/plasmid-like protein (TIGR03299 family)
MPANVQTMFSVKEVPWHGLGHVIQDAPSMLEGFKLAGMDWEVGLEDLIIKSDSRQVDHRAVVRQDNKTILGIVGPRYTPLQNIEAFNWFQPYLDSGEVELNTAGVLDEGRKVWVLAKIKRDNEEIVKGDEMAKFIMLSNSHDGTTAIRTGFTFIRIVCANTLAMAHNDKSSKLIRVRHTQAAKVNLENIRATIDLANEEFKATAEQYRLLARKSVNQEDVKKYVRLMMDIKPETTDKDISTRTKNIISDVMGRMEMGFGAKIPGVKGTAWGLYNAYNEYLNYSRGNNNSNRMESLWFGVGYNDNKNALEAALELV